jgi:glycogen debranching enzyme
MVYPNGKLVEPPIALCEVQGYAYDAWLKAAFIYEVWGEKEQAQKLRQKAEELYQCFNDRFWMEKEGFYCLGLDNKKQQIQSITSNPGHLLWSGIVPKERAKRLVKRIFQQDMWCGWGVNWVGVWSKSVGEGMDNAPCPLPIAPCPLPIAHCPLPIAPC